MSMKNIAVKAIWALLFTLVFVLLVPGVLLTIPNGEKSMLTIGQANMTTVAVHAAVFFFAYLLVKNLAWKLLGRKKGKKGKN
jgi:hypothetical protein